MSTYNIILTNAEDLALSYVSVSQDEWVQNVVHERCRIAIDEIVKITVEKCLETGTLVPAAKEEIVALAFAEGWVKTAEERNAEILAQGQA